MPYNNRRIRPHVIEEDLKEIESVRIEKRDRRPYNVEDIEQQPRREKRRKRQEE